MKASCPISLFTHEARSTVRNYLFIYISPGHLIECVSPEFMSSNLEDVVLSAIKISLRIDGIYGGASHFYIHSLAFISSFIGSTKWTATIYN